MGMEQAGHKCVGFIEIDQSAVRSYRAIFNINSSKQEGEFYADDIRNVMPRDLPDADCWCGGFPCQSFSQAGRREGFADTRGTLIFEVFRLAAVRKPKILFLENVAGLLNHDNARTFGTILSAMAKLGYDVEWQCINSKNYVPQNRERVFIIGHYGKRRGGQIFPIFPKHSASLKQIAGGSQGSRIYDPSGVSCTITSGTGGLGAKTGLYLVAASGSDIKLADKANCIDANYGKGLLANQMRSGILEIRPIISPEKNKVRQNGRRMKNNGKEMFCLTAQDRHGVIIFDGKEYMIRRLTPKETWRLQGFPDWAFNLARAVNSDNALYRQAGNSVTVPVIYEIAKRLVDI